MSKLIIHEWVSQALQYLQISYEALIGEMQYVQKNLQEHLIQQGQLEQIRNVMEKLSQYLAQQSSYKKNVGLASQAMKLIQNFIHDQLQYSQEEKLEPISKTVKWLQDDLTERFRKFPCYRITKQALQNIVAEQPGLSEMSDILSSLKDQAFSTEEDLLKAIESKAIEKKIRTEKIRQYQTVLIQHIRIDDLTLIALQAELLQTITQIWTLYLVTWIQRIPTILRPLMDESLQISKVADEVVHTLYDYQSQKLYRDHDQPPIVVPFLTHLQTAGFDSPTPIIVAHYLSYKQIWTWLSYVHEIGHHIYRNIPGLRDELRVKVMMKLALANALNNTIDYEMLCIWFNWLEEIFADAFGVLLLGKEYIHSQIQMLFHMSSEMVYRIKSGISSREGLLQAADLTHPIPYLRVLGGFEMLECLGIPEPEDIAIQWREFIQDDQPIKDGKVMIRQRNQVLNVKNIPMTTLEDVQKVVVKAILFEPLYALASPASPDKPETLTDVFLDQQERDQREGYVQDAEAAINGDQIPAERYEIRHLLIAAQRKFEQQKDNQQLQELSQRVLALLTSKIKAKGVA